MYDPSLHCRRKHICCYCLHAFITEEILKVILETALKLMINKELKCLKKVNILSSKIMKKLWFMQILKAF